LLTQFSDFPSFNLRFPVALALREQVLAVEQVPVGANDVMVDMIVTPDEIIASSST
jgi:5-formyltetrahydrofolate cyclo-ligase